MIELHETWLREFRGCKLKYYRAHILEMEYRLKGSALLIGGAYHTGLELFYKGKAPAKILKYVSKKHFEPCFKIPGILDYELQRVQLDECITIGMLKAYFKHRKFDKEKWEILEVEHSLKIEYEGYVYQGKMDLVISDLKGKIWGVEHKTASDISNMYVQRLTLDFQILAYLNGMRSIGVKTPGIYYNVMRKPSIKPKIGESLEYYQNRFVNDAVNVRPEFYFPERIPIRRKSISLDDYERQLWMIYKDMKYIMKHGLWYKDDQKCFWYGRCPYILLCQSGVTESNLLFYNINSEGVEIL